VDRRRRRSADRREQVWHLGGERSSPIAPHRQSGEIDSFRVNYLLLDDRANEARQVIVDARPLESAGIAELAQNRETALANSPLPFALAILGVAFDCCRPSLPLRVENTSRGYCLLADTFAGDINRYGRVTRSRESELAIWFEAAANDVKATGDG